MQDWIDHFTGASMGYSLYSEDKFKELLSEIQ
jgi:hypothetical protein